ncbi:MAG: hypothetical protein AB7W47_05540 [Calditrichaceae bacterium]
MGKYNLLEDDELFSPKKREDDQPGDKKDIEKDEIDFDALEKEEPVIIEDSKEKTTDSFDQREVIDLTGEPEQHSSLFDVDQDRVAPAEPKFSGFDEDRPSGVKEKKPSFIQDESFFDEKPDAINYKPILIGAGIVALLFIVYLGLNQWVFKDDTGKIPPTELVEEQPAVSPEELEKTRFLGSLADRTGNELSFIGNILNFSGQNINLSSILLYDNSFLFEVFGKSRDDLAKLNLDLKNKYKDKKFVVLSSSQRPGKNGGIFGLYTAEMNGMPQARELGLRLNSADDAKSWLTDLTRKNQLKMNSIKSGSASSKNNFRVYEVEAVISGNLDGCKSLMNSIGSSASNIKIHKLTLSAADQKTFKLSKYQLKLIVQVFV